MASSLFVRSSRRFASVFRPILHHPRGFSSSSSPSLEELGLVTKRDFYGNLMVKLDKLLLKRLPHTMCRTIRGETLEGVSLSIPGNEKRHETDEALNVFLDFDAKDVRGIGYRAELHLKYNALFVIAHVQPTSDASFIRFYSSRINLGNNIMYKTIHSENKDGGLMLTLHKNPDNAEPIKIY
ncbi:hypothetical protein CTI12_AA165320 [Artemisia annua]|uniref:Uncharacterized protein n=1 Tax=Artemisia annua TaxID=35608 RepID=A0A2U1NSF6_ARTAN|nr:hypothetical protein CTI12_AA165320 [Artemisia annua]